MSEIRSYRDLLVWQKGIELVRNIYRVTQHFPSEERFGLSSQMQRAAVSVPSNIAEGQARESKKDFAHFLRISRGSLAELETQCIIARDLNYASDEDCAAILSAIDELRRMTYALMKTLR